MLHFIPVYHFSLMLLNFTFVSTIQPFQLWECSYERILNYLRKEFIKCVFSKYRTKYIPKRNSKIYLKIVIALFFRCWNVSWFLSTQKNQWSKNNLKWCLYKCMFFVFFCQLKLTSISLDQVKLQSCIMPTKEMRKVCIINLTKNSCT